MRRLTLLAVLLSLSAVALRAAPLTPLVIGLGEVEVAGQPTPMPRPARPGDTIQTSGDSIAQVLVHQNVWFMLSGALGGRGTLKFLPPDPARPGPVFQLVEGVLVYSASRSLEVPDGVQVRVGAVSVRLAEERGLVKIENGAPVVVSTSDPAFGAALASCGAPPAATAVFTRALGRPWSPGGRTANADFAVQLITLVCCLLLLRNVVRPRTDSHGVWPVAVFLVLEYAFSVSRFWIGAAGLRFPAGAALLALLLLVWWRFEQMKKPFAQTPLRRALVHAMRFLGLVLAGNALRFGTSVFAPRGPHAFVTSHRVLLDPTASPLVGRFEARSAETFAYEVLVAVLPLILLIALEKRRHATSHEAYLK